MSDIFAIRAPLKRCGTAFRQLRKNLKVTQTQLTKKSGISRDTIHRLENGRVVDTSSLLILLGALGHTLAFVPKPRVRAKDMRERFAHIHENAE